MNWRPETRPCPLCGTEAYAALGRRGGTAHRSGQGVETTIVRCGGCHAVYPRPFLLPERNPYEAHASDDYFAAHAPQDKAAAARWLVDTARQKLGRTGRLLELGCGRGETLAAAKAQGWAVRGVEMTAAFAARAEGVDIEVAAVEQAKSLDETWDVVLLAAILEHLYEPAECLARIRKALVPGGLLYIDVPNECGLWTRAANAYFRLRGRDWASNLSPTFPPYHVVGFCPASLARALRAHRYEIVHLKTHRWRNELPAGDGLIGKIERRAADLVLSLGARLGMGAGITCWARAPITGTQE